jgi:hypothetical protein
MAAAIIAAFSFSSSHSAINCAATALLGASSHARMFAAHTTHPNRACFLGRRMRPHGGGTGGQASLAALLSTPSSWKVFTSSARSLPMTAGLARSEIVELKFSAVLGGAKGAKVAGARVVRDVLERAIGVFGASTFAGQQANGLHHIFRGPLLPCLMLPWEKNVPFVEAVCLVLAPSQL